MNDISSLLHSFAEIFNQEATLIYHLLIIIYSDKLILILILPPSLDFNIDYQTKMNRKLNILINSLTPSQKQCSVGI